VWSFFVVPFHEFFHGFERGAVVVVGLEPFLNFAVALRVFYAAKYLLNSVGIKELFESRVPVDNISGELTSVIADTLFDFAMLECNSHSANAFVQGWTLAFDEGEQFSARIINDCENPKAASVVVPVDVHSRQAVPSLVANPVLLPNDFLEHFLG